MSSPGHTIGGLRSTSDHTSGQASEASNPIDIRGLLPLGGLGQFADAQDADTSRTICQPGSEDRGTGCRQRFRRKSTESPAGPSCANSSSVSRWLQESSSSGFVARLEMGLTFRGDVLQLPAKDGGTQQLTVKAGKAHANRLYWIFGSVMGTSPGVKLLGVNILLMPDAYTKFTIVNPNTRFLKNSWQAGFRGARRRHVPGSSVPAGRGWLHVLPCVRGVRRGRKGLHGEQPGDVELEVGAWFALPTAVPAGEDCGTPPVIPRIRGRGNPWRAGTSFHPRPPPR